MILRLWHGWTLPENADAYEQLLRDEIFPAIQRRAGAGLRDIQLVRRPVEREVEFATLLWFDSLDIVRAFAGDSYEVAVVPPRAQQLLSRFQDRAAHFELRHRMLPAE